MISEDRPVVTLVSGVSQGTVLGPLLCFILLNDFDTDIGSNIISFGLKFADDKHVFRGVNGTVGRDNLQFDLDTVYL